MGRISALTELTELASNDYLLVLDSSASIAKKISVANAFGIPDFGWVVTGESWTFASWSSTTKIGTITVPTDATVKYYPGMRIRISQSTGGVKYGIIVKVAATLLTVFFGTDYTLNNEAISSPVYSAEKTPVGFNASPNKWKLELNDTTSRSQGSPTNGTWYNMGSLSLTIPAGSWNVLFTGQYYFDFAGSGDRAAGITLSTSTSSETDKEFSTYYRVATLNSNIYNEGGWKRQKVLDLTSDTTYYPIMKSSGVSSATTLLFSNSVSPLRVTAISAYL